MFIAPVLLVGGHRLKRHIVPDQTAINMPCQLLDQRNLESNGVHLPCPIVPFEFDKGRRVPDDHSQRTLMQLAQLLRKHGRMDHALAIETIYQLRLCGLATLRRIRIIAVDEHLHLGRLHHHIAVQPKVVQAMVQDLLQLRRNLRIARLQKDEVVFVIIAVRVVLGDLRGAGRY